MLAVVDSTELAPDERKKTGRIDSWGEVIYDVSTRMIRVGGNTEHIVY